MNEKNNIRLHIKSLKRNLSNNDMINCAEMVFSKLYSLDEWNKATNILFYYSLPDELQTLPFIDHLTNKKIYIPRVNGDNLDIIRYDKESIQKGYQNIMEPIESNISVQIKDIDIVLVPGIAFDLNKNRLGRGKGFYDRLLNGSKCIKIALAYDFQILEKIPAQPHDVKMNIIITPNHIIR